MGNKVLEEYDMEREGGGGGILRLRMDGTDEVKRSKDINEV